MNQSLDFTVHALSLMSRKGKVKRMLVDGTLKQWYYDLIDFEVCSEETLNFAIGTYGNNEETFDNIAYYFTGYDMETLEEQQFIY